MHQRPWIDHDPIADDRQLAGPHHPRREQAQLVLDIADDESVAGIVTALKANHDIGPLRQPVYDFSFALVTRLGADPHDVAHFALLLTDGHRLAMLENTSATKGT